MFVRVGFSGAGGRGRRHAFARLLLRAALLTGLPLACLASGNDAVAVVAPLVVPEAVSTPAKSSRLGAKRPLMAVTTAGKRIVAVGRLGQIVYSDDQGQNWTQAAVPVGVDLVAVHFPSARRGWATGHDGVVLRTDDGGTSWTRILDGRQAARLLVDYYGRPGSRPGSRQDASGDPQIAAALEESRRYSEEDGARPFLDVWFENDETGFIVGAWGLILRTSDGGKSWEPWMHRLDNPRHSHLNAIRAVDGVPWMVGDQGLVLRLDPVHKRFVRTTSPAGGSLFGLVGDRRGVVVFGLLGKAFVTRDGGATWVRSVTPGSVGLTGGTTFPNGDIVLVDTAAGVWISRDNGASFASLPVQQPMSWFGVAAVGDKSLAMVGSLGVLAHTVSH